MQYHIVGLDLSLSATGVARIRPGADRPITLSLVTSSPVPNAKYPHTLDRIRGLASRIIAAIKLGAEPDDIIVVVMEGGAFMSTTGHAHTRAGLWWLMYHLIEKFALVVVVEPSKLKRYITGKGNAPKDLVFSSVVRNYPGIGIVDNNEADALGLASMASRELGYPMEPSVQRCTPSALEGVDWPEHIIQQRRNRNG